MSSTTLGSAQAPAPRRSRRGLSFWIGMVLIAAGLSLLGYAGWQFFGTNVVAHHKQAVIIQETRRAWAGSNGNAGAGGSAQGIELRGAEALVRIPRFGRNYLVPVQHGVTDAVLAEGFGHFPQSVAPGQVGNYAIAGHRVTHGQPLRGMPSLRPGDTVIVETRTKTFTYRIDTNPNDLIVTFKDIWVVSALPHNPRGGVQPAQRAGQRLITMTTCSELFHTDNRMIVFGHLISTRAR